MKKSFYRKRKYYRSSPQNLQSFLEEILGRILQFGAVILLLILFPYYMTAIEYYFQFVTYIWKNPVMLIPVGIFVVGIAFIVFRFQKYRSHKKYMALQKFNEVMQLDWREFEKFVAAILEEKGFTTLLWVWVRDWGIDITAILDDQKYFVQCKHYSDELIGVEKIRELNWVMNGEGIPSGGIFVTTTWFTSDAVSESKKYGIELWDKNYLKKWIESHSETILPNKWIPNEVCERCWWKLILRTAHKWMHDWEQFLWCENYPKCTYIKQL